MVIVLILLAGGVNAYELAVRDHHLAAVVFGALPPVACVLEYWRNREDPVAARDGLLMSLLVVFLIFSAVIVGLDPL
ncbi:hypothetical protein [Enhygromyxa salina]|uniref:hypothetical protein n=1 Tax=Enhygromyxa salina TaxID=215803 RepID=UPI0011B23E79|nr:hypothetical protein [Enhygromyxa salina]